MSYAIIQTGGKQYRVEPGRFYDVELLNFSPTSSLTITDVLLVNGDGVEGNTLAIGQPLVESTIGNSTQTNIEAFYKFPLSENISITPDLQFIINPNNNSSNSLITVGTLRTVFSF